MTYRVLTFFTDLLDSGYPYHAGDIYPREGYTATKKRIVELSGGNNKQGKPLIKAVSERKKK